MKKKLERLVNNNAAIFWMNNSIRNELKNKIITSHSFQSKNQDKNTSNGQCLFYYF